MNTYQRTVWEEVFCGGEGLYYTFKNKDIKEKANVALTNYLTAIDEIEKEFKRRRHKFFNEISEKEVNSAFESANTKAFQIGLFMALDYFKESKSFIDAYEEFLTLLNSVSEVSWIIVLNYIRAVLIKGVDPKQWPSYKNLILRIIQRKDIIFYDKDNFIDSPDGWIFNDYVTKYFNNWWDTNDINESDLTLDSIGIDIVMKWAKSCQEQVENLFKRASITTIDGVDYLELTQRILIGLINKINPKST
jgi:hypothetical protein